MEKLIPKFERKEDKIPAKFIFGIHDEKNAPKNASLFEKMLEYQFQKTSHGHVLAVIEDAFRPLASANSIENLVIVGTRPSDAYASAIFWEENSRAPKSQEEFTAYYQDILRQGLPEELKVLDKVFTGFPERLRVVWEGTPEEVFRSELQTSQKVRQDLKKTYKLARRGKFDEALLYYKKAQTALVNRAIKREKRIEERILEAVEEDQITGIVGYFGECHTHLVHFLNSYGFSTKMIFPEKLPEERYLLYSPGEIILRTLRFLPERGLTKLEWLKSLIGSLIYSMTTVLEIPSQEASRLIQKYLLNFTDLATIKEFEKEVRKKGLVEAVEACS